MYAKTYVLFSPEGPVKETIIENIKLSEKTIDIAAFMFTAGEIAEALHNAKERGVKIRIVIDQRQNKKSHPVLEFIKEEGFDLQFLKGNIGGHMNNTFAIFDARQLVTGSYNWTEYAEKYNYENAVFIDDPSVIKMFREEFEILYEKSTTSRISELEEITELNKEKTLTAPDEAVKEGKSIKEANLNDGTAASVVRENDTLTKEPAQKEQTKSTISTPEDFLDIPFKEFDSIFGEKSSLKKAEKKQLWEDEFKGKHIKWTGKILFMGIAVYDWNRVIVDHEGSDTDVQLRFDWTKRGKVMRLKVGDVINYTGRLVSLQGYSSSYKIVGADVLETK